MLDFSFLSLARLAIVGECLGVGFRDLGSSISSTCFGLLVLLLPFTSLRRVSKIGINASNHMHKHKQC